MICKICRVRDIHAARLLAQLGADLLGLHAIYRLKKKYLLSYKQITAEMATCYPHVGTVLLTKVENIQSIIRMVKQINPNYVQLHTYWNASQVEKLRSQLVSQRQAHIQIIAVIDPERIGSKAEDIRRVAQAADLILLDRHRGGTGRLIAPTHMRACIKLIRPRRILIAGGLSHKNVKKCINRLKPHGVDVQSGVERSIEHGTKDPRLAARFISEAKSRIVKLGWKLELPENKATISVALTNTRVEDLDDQIQKFAMTDIDIVHLDHSDGSLTPAFVTDSRYIAKRLEDLSPMLIYDLHIFGEYHGRSASLIRSYLSINPALRAVHVYLQAGKAMLASARNTMINLRRLGVTPVAAFQASQASEVFLHTLHEWFQNRIIDEVSVIAPSEKHRLSEFVNVLVPVLGQICNWRRGSGRLKGIGVDRDLSVRRVRAILGLGINRIVIGKEFLNLKYPQRRITLLRRSLQMINSAA